jgi:2,3-bisphosphoglycerate-independent phosphoglycerate mutase
VTHILFIFLDGVGLGSADPATNPLAAAEIPTLTGLLGGRRPLAGTPRLETERALFIPTDAGMGVEGPPQSATGQATILTGRNVPREIGRHWGPKPSPEVAAILREGSVFSRLAARGLRAGLLNAYPQRYFEAIASGRRSYSAIPLAVTAAGLHLMTADDLRVGQALSADFTGEGWPEPGAPVYGLRQAGRHLAELAAGYRFAFYEHWITDYAGHRGSLEEGCTVIERLDAVLGGLLEDWDDSNGLIVITSDHGNLEDLSHRHHTQNQVPTLIIGGARREFGDGLVDLTGFAGAIERHFLDSQSTPLYHQP